MKTTHIFKALSLVLLTALIGVFTHCSGPAPTQLNVGSTVRNPAGDVVVVKKDEGQIIQEMVVATGVKNHEQILMSMSALTGVDSLDAKVRAVYNQVETSLPTENDIKTFVPANQVAITKLAAEYCSVLVNTDALRKVIWPNFNFALQPKDGSLSMANRDYIIDQAILTFWGEVVSDEEKLTAKEDMNELIDEILIGEKVDAALTTTNTVKAVCTTALSTAHVTLL